MRTNLWAPSMLLSYSVAEMTLDQSVAFELGADDADYDESHFAPVPSSAASTSSVNLTVKAILQTPVIVLPRTPTSPEVLMVHLGRIVIENSSESKKSDNAVNRAYDDIADSPASGENR